MITIGHRGAAGYAPENTISSIQKALDLNAKGIEIDIHRCRTGEIVVIHDETVDRTTNGSGNVTDLSWQDLQELRIGTYETIPCLETILDMLPKSILLNIELKGKGCTEGCLDCIENAVSASKLSYANFILSSFDWDMLKEVRQRHETIRIGILEENDWEKAMRMAFDLDAFAIHPDFQTLTAKKVKEAQEKGYRVFPWTVNEDNAIEQMMDWEIDGIITDYPDRVESLSQKT